MPPHRSMEPAHFSGSKSSDTQYNASAAVVSTNGFGGIRSIYIRDSEVDEIVFFNLFTGIPALMIQDMMRNLAACSGFSHVA